MTNKYVETPVSFARVNKIPLDAYEVFSSGAEALDYVQNGPCYPSQEIIINGRYYSSTFLINNSKHLLPVSVAGYGSQMAHALNEFVYKTISNHTYLLVYSYKEFAENTQLFTSEAQTEFKDDGFSFNILGISSTLVFDSKTSFYVEKIDSSGNITTKTFDSTSTPLNNTSSSNIFYKINDNTSYYNITDFARICPKVKLGYDVNIYMRCV